MLNHTTTSVAIPDNPYDTTAIVLVGTPAVGKSTIRNILEDYGATSVELERYHTGGEITNDSWKEYIESRCEMSTTSKPKVCVIDGPITTEQTDFIESITSGMLTIRVTVPSASERQLRYVARKITNSGESGQSISGELLEEVDADVTDRVRNEEPYPPYDVEINNSDDCSISQLTTRIANIVIAVSDMTSDDISTPDDHTPFEQTD